MKYKTLGRTGIQVSELCYGTMSFGGDADPSESAKMYAACREKGINFFDCANVYSQGKAEEILGNLIKHERNELIITSKCFFPMGNDINAKGANRRNIMSSVEASLKRLGTDHLDVLFIHKWDDTTPIEETLRALNDLVSQGKVLYLGASNFSAWQVAKAIGISDKNNWAKFDILQPMYSMVKRQAESEILPLAKHENLGEISYSPVGGGLLSGKYTLEKKSETGRIATDERYQQRYGESWLLETAGKFTELAKQKNIHPVSMAVAWAAAHPAITCPIIGSRNLEQLQPSLESININISQDLHGEIAALGRTPAPATDRLEEQ